MEEKKQPYLPAEYESFLIALFQSRDDFRHFADKALDRGWCSIDVIEYFAVLFGYNWKPKWR